MATVGGGLVGFAGVFGLGRAGGFLWVVCPADILFHRLAEAVAFAVHLENVATVREAIQERGGHAVALEYLAPIAEGKVAGD